MDFLYEFINYYFPYLQPDIASSSFLGFSGIFSAKSFT